MGPQKSGTGSLDETHPEGNLRPNLRRNRGRHVSGNPSPSPKKQIQNHQSQKRLRTLDETHPLRPRKRLWDGGDSQMHRQNERRRSGRHRFRRRLLGNRNLAGKIIHTARIGA